MKQRLSLYLSLTVMNLLLPACSFSVDSFSDSLNQAVMSNNDPQTVSEALPAYLIMMDGLLESDPEDEDVLKASAKLMGAYAGLLGAQLELMEDQQNSYRIEVIKVQQKKLTTKALKRMSSAICLYEEQYCDLTSLKFSEFESRLDDIDEDDIDMLFSLATAWTSWIQINSEDWNARAQLPQVKLILEKVLKIDEKWENAGAHMYLGVLNSLLPASLGGKPEIGKTHFEAAIKLTNGNNLMAKVLYAEYYARLTFNEVLHQTLISDVITAENTQADMTLMNTLARQKAVALQASSADYF